MAHKISWDEYEVALLIEACLDVLNGQAKKYVVQMLSFTLREKARLSGIKIDDIFRNINGITLQMSKMDYFLTNGDKGLPGGSSTFEKMAALYQNDKARYEIILKEAKKMTTSAGYNENQFVVWLSSKTTLSQRTELLVLYNQIESFCKRIMVLSKPLFETTDLKTLAHVRQTVESNKVFRFTHKKLLPKFTSAIGYYITFIKERGFYANEDIVFKPSIEKQTTAQVDAPKTATTTNVSIVDFKNHEPLAFTKPIRLVYFGNAIEDLKSWTNLYVVLVRRMISDYPNQFEALKGKSISPSGRIDIGGTDHFSRMTAPKVISHDLYLETNLSATSIVTKIRLLLNLCIIDYKKVVITYTSTKDNLSNDSTKNRVFRPAVSVSASDRVEQFSAWLSANYADATCRSYVSAINSAEEFARQHNYSNVKLFSNDWYETKATYDELFRDEVFVAWNQKQHNRFHAAIKKLIEYERDDISKSNEQEDNSLLEPIKEVLLGRYKKGYRIGSPLEMRKFKFFYEEINCMALDIDETEIERMIKKCGIVYEDKLYCPGTMISDEMKQKLFSYIDGCFAEGKQNIYFEAIFKEFSEDFLDHCIYNADMLKAYLEYMNDGNFYVFKNYISKDDKAVDDPIDEIRTCLVENASPMFYDDMFKILSHIPQDKVRWTLVSSREFVSNGRNQYFHIDTFHISADELSCVSDLIAQGIEEKKFIGGNELVNAIKHKYPSINEENAFLSDLGIRNALAIKLGDRFSFNGNIISKNGQQLSMKDVFDDFCKNRSHFTFDELNVLASELNTVIYFDTIYENALRISQSEFVAKDQANFKVKETDAAISLFCKEDFIAINDITMFASFPEVGFTWNSYLLESYVAHYSQDFKLIHSNFNATSTVGAIVKCGSAIETFDDLVAEVLAFSECTLKKDAALQYLCENGYLAKRIFANIEQVLIAAQTKRNRKG